MADVTISSLPLGTPSGSALLPFSLGGTTYSNRPSAFIAASIMSGDVLQSVFSSTVGRSLGIPTSNNTFPFQETAITQPQGSKFLSVSIIPKQSNSNLFITVNVPTISETVNHSDHVGYGIWRDGNNTPINLGWSSPSYNPYPICSSNHTTFINFNASVNAGNTEARTYSFYSAWNAGAAVINAVGSCNLYNNGVTSYMRIDEIAT